MLRLTKDTTAAPVQYNDPGLIFPYSSSKYYYLDEVVFLANNYYICITPCAAEVPPNAAYWKLIDLEPVLINAVIDGTGTPAQVIASTLEPLYLWANSLNRSNTAIVSEYTDITVSIVSLDTGILWELSLDNTTFSDTIYVPGTINVAGTYQTLQIYARAVVENIQLIVTDNYTTPVIRLLAAEIPI